MLERASFVVSLIASAALVALHTTGNLRTATSLFCFSLSLALALIFASQRSKSRQLRRATGKNFQLQHDIDRERIHRSK